MSRALHVTLLVSSAIAAALQGSPSMLSIIPNKIKGFGDGDAQNIPDGKMWMMRRDPNDDSAGYIINPTPNFFLESSSSSINDVTAIYNNPSSADQAVSQSNFLQLPNTIPIPSASTTGMRGDGTLYDPGSLWIFNAFRLSETSQPGADSNSLIGFEHNEDYWADEHPTASCTYKSIGVRCSHDLGKSWTRSVPIVTSGQQAASCTSANPFTGMGDFGTMWNPDKNQWVIIGPEMQMSMSVSSDALASPGSWSRWDPATGKTAPGYNIDSVDASLGDLSASTGSIPSIIRDEKNAVWHMVYAKWGGGIAYAKSSDMQRWDEPYLIWPGDSSTPDAMYPTLVGDQGDILSTDGTATLYFTASNTISFGRPLWSVGIDFGTNSTSSGNTTVVGGVTSDNFDSI